MYTKIIVYYNQTEILPPEYVKNITEAEKKRKEMEKEKKKKESEKKKMEKEKETNLIKSTKTSATKR